MWRRFRVEADPACRERLFEAYRDLARAIARQQHRRRPSYGLDRLDFEQLAYEGLLQAIDRYDPLRGVPFRGFARRRIEGAISDGIVQSSEGGAQYGARRRMETDRMRSLARRADEGRGDAIETLSDLVTDLALGLLLEGSGLIEPEDGACRRPDAYENLCWRELETGLADAVGALPHAQRTIVVEHYRNGVAFVQIAQILGVSKGRVSQLHRSAVETLRRRLGRHA